MYYWQWIKSHIFSLSFPLCSVLRMLTIIKHHLKYLHWGSLRLELRKSFKVKFSQVLPPKDLVPVRDCDFLADVFYYTVTGSWQTPHGLQLPWQPCLLVCRAQRCTFSLSNGNVDPSNELIRLTTIHLINKQYIWRIIFITHALPSGLYAVSTKFSR